MSSDAERALAYFSRACELRFQAGCVNLLDARTISEAPPRAFDLRLLLRAGRSEPDRDAGTGALRARLHTRLDASRATGTSASEVQGSTFEVQGATARVLSCCRAVVAAGLLLRVFVSSWPSSSCSLLPRVLQRAERTRGGAGGLRRSARGANHDGHRACRRARLRQRAVVAGGRHRQRRGRRHSSSAGTK